MVMFCTMPISARVRAGPTSIFKACASGIKNENEATPSLTLPTTATPRVTSSSSPATSPVATISTTNGINRTANSARLMPIPIATSPRASHRREASSRTSATPPMTSVTRLTPETFSARDASTCQLLVPTAGMPSKNLIWLSTIRIAEPEIKPLMTGRLNSCDKNPSRKAPNANTSTPENSDSVAANIRYCGLPGVSSGDNTAKVMIAVMATGPTACVMLLPSKA